jgi:hypothetical protein
MCLCFFRQWKRFFTSATAHNQSVCVCVAEMCFKKKRKLHASIPNLHNHNNFNCWDLRTSPSSSQYIPFFHLDCASIQVGTVLNAADARKAIGAGAQFLMSPGTVLVSGHLIAHFFLLTSSVVIRCWLNHEDCVCFRTYFMILKKVMFFIFQECWHQLKYVSHDMCKLPSYSVKVVLSYAIFVFFDIFSFWHSQVLSACSAGATVVKVS